MFLFLTSIYCSANYIVMYKEPDNKSDVNEKILYEDNYTHIMNEYKDEVIIKNKMRNGFIAIFNENTKKKLEKDSKIAIIEKDAKINIAYKNSSPIDIAMPFEIFENSKKDNPKKYFTKNSFYYQKNAPWGISRIVNGKNFKHKESYVYPENAGKMVDVYIIDTGIEINHPEFQDRARLGINLVEGSVDTDEHGHGTHCAGVIGGKNTGIAKYVNLVAIKALDKNGAGLISRLMLGLDYVIQEHELKRHLLEEEKNIGQISSNILDTRKKRTYLKKIFKKLRKNYNKNYKHHQSEEPINKHSVINMSVGGGKSAILDYAIQYATKQGIHFSVAAGNDHKNACAYSPGSSKKALTVGATTRNDKVAFFSNYGECVKIFAPGVNISSSWIKNSYKIASGTSMAAPHVTGIMAVYLTFDNYKPNELMEQIKKDAYSVVEDTEDKTLLSQTWPFNLVFKNEKKYPLVSLKPLLMRLKKNK
ncbi:Subtilisin-like serine protease [Spraguea lophii 42_110]|uniref:Subtilisin-like serine protease n=1 Tax=Spraguea lophii (strain 42_110) TaxID=1358809 RepID=S7XVA8_SPRLO|nr:Subtilisin-like serine protease [Spraguea lophii 42_110]